MMTQSELILQHLREYGSITPMDSIHLYGCMRLGARIYDLKQEGYDITVERETAINRFGKPVTYARYRLRGDKHEPGGNIANGHRLPERADVPQRTAGV